MARSSVLSSALRVEPKKAERESAAKVARAVRGRSRSFTLLLPDGTLVVGNHRVAAARMLGWTTIRATIKDLDELDAELAEIDENLRRTELTVLEQADHLLRREQILEAKGLRATRGTNLKNSGTGFTVTPVPDADANNRTGETVSPVPGTDNLSANIRTVSAAVCCFQFR